MKKISIFIAVVLFAALTACNSNGKKYTLKPNMKAGESYGLLYKVEIDQDMSERNNKMMINMSSVMKIKNITAQKDIELDFLYDHVSMKIASGGLTIDYDTDSISVPAQNYSSQVIKDAMDNSLGKLVNKPVQVTINAMGKVKEVKGYNEILRSMDSSGKGNQFNELIGEKQIDQLFQQTFNTFPTKPVAIGEEWVNEIDMNQNGIPLKYKNTYKLVEVLEKENEAVIDLKGTVSMEKHDDKNGVKMDGTGIQTGKLVIDMNTGLVKTGKQVMDIKVNIEAGGTKMPMTMKGLINLQGKKL